MQITHDRSVEKNELLRDVAKYEDIALKAEARVKKLEAQDCERLHVIHEAGIAQDNLEKKLKGMPPGQS